MTDGRSLATKMKIMAKLVGFCVEVKAYDVTENGVTVEVRCLGTRNGGAPVAYVIWTGHDWQIDLCSHRMDEVDVKDQRFNANTEQQVVEATLAALLCRYVETEWEAQGWN